MTRYGGPGRNLQSMGPRLVNSMTLPAGSERKLCQTMVPQSSQRLGFGDGHSGVGEGADGVEEDLGRDVEGEMGEALARGGELVGLDEMELEITHPEPHAGEAEIRAAELFESEELGVEVAGGRQVVHGDGHVAVAGHGDWGGHLGPVLPSVAAPGTAGCGPHSTGLWHDREMERWPGPIDQLGYVVDDIEGAMGHWTSRLGVGPFYFLPGPPLEALTYRGRPTAARIAVALAFCGPLQVELIQPLDDEPTPYRDFMAAHGTGLHHVGRFVDDYDEAVAGYGRRGMEPYFGGRGLTEKQRFCYFDTESHGGTVSEVIETAEIGAFFDVIRAAGADWDGSDPIRTVGG